MQRKVENILKGSLFSIPSPSPSVKIQIMGRKVCLRCKGKTSLDIATKIWKKKFADITQQCFALLAQVNFLANNLNFHWSCRWWDWIQSIFLNLIYFSVVIHLSWIFAKELSTCLPTTHTHSELLSDLSTTLLTMYCLAYESRFRTWNFDRKNELHYSFQSVISLHLDIYLRNCHMQQILS